jgi:ubiquinone/menaquinone biosynthesis C-methylase UbiE
MMNIRDFIRKELRIVQIIKMEERPEVLWFINNNKIAPYNVLDVCGGWGMWMFLLKKKIGKDFRYTCVDIDKKNCSDGVSLTHHYKYNNNRFINADINDGMNLQGNKFDQIWMFGWWVCGPTVELFNEIKTLLNKDGLLFINYREQDRKFLKGFIMEKECFIKGYGDKPFDFYISVYRGGL